MSLAGRTPTTVEQIWMDRIVQVGCVICWIYRAQYTPAEVHHIEGKTKPNAHLLTLPLCGRHHRFKGEHWVSRHGNGKKAFESAYMSEADLLEVTQSLVEEMVLRGMVA